MLWVGPVELLLRPVIEPSLYSSRYCLALFGFGFLYFALAEGIWGGGPGKRLKGLRVVRLNGRVPGVGRALVRILVPILSVEAVRMPLMIFFLQGAELTGDLTEGKFEKLSFLTGTLRSLLDRPVEMNPPSVPRTARSVRRHLVRAAMIEWRSFSWS